MSIDSVSELTEEDQKNAKKNFKKEIPNLKKVEILEALFLIVLGY